MSERFLLTSSFEPIQKGEGFKNGRQLPLHVTIHQYFMLEMHRPFLNSLMNYATGLRPFEVVGQSRELFGRDNDVPVTTVREFGRLSAVHAATLELIDRFGGELAYPAWHGAGYNPHVTDTSERRLEPGETAVVGSIELIRSRGSDKEVLTVLPFGDGQHG